MRLLARRAGVAAALLVAALGFDRVTRLPTAEPVGEARTRTAASGQVLTLAGLGGRELIAFETGAGQGVIADARRVTFEGRPVRHLTWRVGRSDGGDPALDRKVGLRLEAAGVARPALSLSWAGQDDLRPVLGIDVADAPVRVVGAFMPGEDRALPDTSLTIDERVADGPALFADFTVAPGGKVELTFPAFADGSPRNLVVRVGDADGSGASRLPVSEVVVSEAGSPLARACAAPAGRTLWKAALTGPPRGADCATDGALAVTGVRIAREAVTAGLAGTGWFTGAKPGPARWWAWAQSNPVFAGLFGAAMAALLAWARRAAARPAAGAPSAAAT